MNWSYFIQLMLAFLFGAQTYAAGKAGASIFAPLTNAIQRSIETFSRRHDENPKDENISPSLRS